MNGAPGSLRQHCTPEEAERLIDGMVEVMRVCGPDGTNAGDDLRWQFRAALSPTPNLLRRQVTEIAPGWYHTPFRDLRQAFEAAFPEHVAPCRGYAENGQALVGTGLRSPVPGVPLDVFLAATLEGLPEDAFRQDREDVVAALRAGLRRTAALPAGEIEALAVLAALSER